MVQLLGVTSSPRRNALLYHDGKRDTVPLGPFSLLFYSIAGLIPLDEYRQIYKQSTVMSALLEYEIVCFQLVQFCQFPDCELLRAGISL
jgi:hypothetical protein